MNPQQPHPTRPSRAGWLIAVVLALVAGILVAPPADAEPGKPKVAAAAAPALSSDISGSLPRVGHDEAVGDFLKLGYQQRAVVEDGNLNIYAPPDRGGNRLRSTPTDLQVPKDGDAIYTFYPKYRPSMKSIAEAQRLSSIYLAWAPDGFYLAGGVEVGQQAKYGVVLYKLPPDGSCARWDCATWIKTDIDDLSASVRHRLVSLGDVAGRGHDRRPIGAGGGHVGRR